MKYKVGDKIKIIKGTSGCFGAGGKIGIVTDKRSNNGLFSGAEGFNVECNDGTIWRIGFDSVCELLDELTAEEVIRLHAEMCGPSCSGCELSSSNNGTDSSCREFSLKHPERVVEILKQWKKDHEKKPIETEHVWYVQIIEADTHLLKHEELLETDFSIPMGKKEEEILKKYCSEHDGKYYAIREMRCVVKE